MIERNKKFPATDDSAPSAIDREVLQEESKVHQLPRANLIPFEATGRTAWAVPFAFEDYLELVDWTGRAVHPTKHGHIPSHVPRILDRLGIDPERFIAHAEHLLKAFGSAVGAPQSLVNLCARRQSKYLRGMNTAKKIFAVKRAA